MTLKSCDMKWGSTIITFWLVVSHSVNEKLAYFFISSMFILNNINMLNYKIVFFILYQLLPPETRHLNATFATLVWALGVMLLPLVSWLCRDLSWRTTQAVYGVTNSTIILQIL